MVAGAHPVFISGVLELLGSSSSGAAGGTHLLLQSISNAQSALAEMPVVVVGGGAEKHSTHTTDAGGLWAVRSVRTARITGAQEDLCSWGYALGLSRQSAIIGKEREHPS